jgi:hypothetical protein
MSLAKVSSIAPDGKILAPDTDHVLGDLRFRALLSDENWDQLPWRIRRRFSKRLAAGDTAIYVGEIVEAYLSKAGWLLAQALRLIGGPLPTSRDVDVAAVVSVTEDMRTGGQIWTRLYARRRGFPQVIHSAKRFAGRTGLEEYVGFGVGMELTLEVEDAAIVFRSAGYFLQILRRRFSLPAWAAAPEPRGASSTSRLTGSFSPGARYTPGSGSGPRRPLGGRCIGDCWGRLGAIFRPN